MTAESIAGHLFDSTGICTGLKPDGTRCGREWADIRNTVEEEINNQGIAHTGGLTRNEYDQIVTRRNTENAKIADAMKAVATGASW